MRAQAVVTTGEVTNAYLNILQRRYWPQLLMVGLLLGGTVKAEGMPTCVPAVINGNPSYYCTLSLLIPPPLPLPPLSQSFFLPCFQQFTGINAIMFYSPQMFEAAGQAGSDALLSTCVMGAVNVGSTLVAIAIVDRQEIIPTLLPVGLVQSTYLPSAATCWPYTHILPHPRSVPSKPLSSLFFFPPQVRPSLPVYRRRHPDVHLPRHHGRAHRHQL